MRVLNPRILNPTLTCMRERDETVAEQRCAGAGLHTNSFRVNSSRVLLRILIAPTADANELKVFHAPCLIILSFEIVI